MLSSSPWTPAISQIHEAPAALVPVAAAPSPTAAKSISIVETGYHGTAVLITDVVPDFISGGPAEGDGFGVIERPQPANEFGRLNDFGAMSRPELLTALRPVSFAVNPAPLETFNTAVGVLRTTVSPLPPPGPPLDAGQRDRALPPIVLGADDSAIRFMVWMSDMSPLEGMQGPPQGYGQFDLRGRLAELVHDTLSAGHLVSDNAHSNTEASSDEAMLEAVRNHAINPALFGQSGETDSMFRGAGRNIGETLTSFAGSGETRGALDRQVLGPLVAAGDATAAWATAVWAAGSRALGGEGDTSAVDRALHELLAPRFAFDAALLGQAIGDLVSEADELGVSLLGFLTDPAQHGEVALLAGVAAGLAYRHWRGRERREQAESRAMLEARFVTGPASLRLGGRNAS